MRGAGKVVKPSPAYVCEKLDSAHVQLICVQSNAPLTFRLAERSNVWRERYRDAWAVIFERFAPPTNGP